MKSVLTDIERTAATEYTFKTKVAELKQLVREHVQEEEGGMLAQARRLFSQDELDEIGHRMMQLLSIHSPVYEVGGNKVQRLTRDTIQRIGDVIAKVTG